MNKDQKKNYIEEMSSKFENSKAVMVTHYQGLTMTQLDDLRAKMREHGIVFKITKNRITKLALEKTKCKDLTNLLLVQQRLLLEKMQSCQQGFSQNLQKITKI
jgi:large subunit ribosomal protein L10